MTNRITALGMPRHSELWLMRRGEIAEAVKYLLRNRDLKMRKSIAEVLFVDCLFALS